MSASLMNTIIKNNRNMLPQREKFKKTLGGYNTDKQTAYDLPKATSKQLSAIRKRMQAERRVWWVKVIALTLIIFLGLVWGVVVVLLH